MSVWLEAINAVSNAVLTTTTTVCNAAADSILEVVGVDTKALKDSVKTKESNDRGEITICLLIEEGECACCESCEREDWEDYEAD